MVKLPRSIYGLASSIRMASCVLSTHEHSTPSESPRQAGSSEISARRGIVDLHSRDRDE